MIYTTGTTASLLNVSRETVRTWAEEFARHLSSVANPDSGKHRQFTEDDLKKLAVVAKLKRYGRTYQDIHEALEKGETADLDTTSLVLGTNVREIQLLQVQVAELERQLNEAKTASAVDRALREQAEHHAATLEKEVRELREQIGGLKARISPPKE